MSFEPQEKGVPIRQPATANLQVDSADRDEARDPSPFSFTIQRPNSILNGFFTRIGMTETQLQWDVPNINQSSFNNGVLGFDLALFSSGVSTVTSSISLNYQNCWVKSSSNFFSTTVGRLNPLVSSLSTTFALDLSGFEWNLVANNSEPGITTGYRLQDTPLAYQTTLGPTFGFRNAREIVNPDFRPYRYIDFVSPNLTYNQDLKDTSTNPTPVDVLQRWFFSYDQENSYDGNNWPIYMGYKPFSMRRVFPLPKQIKWDSAQPIGQLKFEVYGQPIPLQTGNPSYYTVIPPSVVSYDTNYQFTLQVSET